LFEKQSRNIKTRPRKRPENIKAQVVKKRRLKIWKPPASKYLNLNINRANAKNPTG
jgi:hypothetical protein